MSIGAAPPALEILRIEAVSLPAAHAVLGRHLAVPIREVCTRRLRETPAAELAAQLRSTRASRVHLERLATDARLPSVLRRALRSYLDCLQSWVDAAGLADAANERLAAERVAGLELGLWLQDDNTGCQTGVIRSGSGSVLLLHTEEDTIGYFDRPRLLELSIGDTRRASFLYPYLLPGPAFGWQARRLTAYDTLTVARTAGGTPTSALSWLLWAHEELTPEATAQALIPFLDGGAWTVVERDSTGVAALVLEAGGQRVCASPLGSAAGSRRFQMNAVSDAACALRPLEELSTEQRLPYQERLQRAERLIGPTPNPQQLWEVLASREGDSWAFANDDVVACLVAEVTRDGMSLALSSGPASAGGPAPVSFACG